jgi:hypothetical protein
MNELNQNITETTQDILEQNLDLGVDLTQISVTDLSDLSQNLVINSNIGTPVYTYHPSSGIKLDTNGQKIQLNNMDLELVLNQILDRLKILVPDPELLEKYQALGEAYDHYKTLEALCTKSHDKK